MELGREIGMKYPYDSSGKNPAFDGTVHRIIPNGIAEIFINNRPFYVMSYYDKTVSGNCITLLAVVGNNLIKVPLDEYDTLVDYIKHNPLHKLDRINVPGDIMLGEPMSASSLLYQTATDSLIPPNSPYYEHRCIPEYYHSEYVPVHLNSSGNTLCGCYSFSCCVIDPYHDNAEYHYRKAPDNPRKTFLASEGAGRFLTGQLGSDTYQFAIEVKEGQRGTISSVDKDGHPVHEEVILLPGIHHYEITYAHCKYRSDYLASRLGEQLIVEAPYKEYHDIHGKKEVFRDGMIGTLNATFYDHSKQPLESKDREIIDGFSR